MIQPVVPPALVDGHGPPVVLLHAFPVDGRMWAPQVAALRERCQVIVPDVRGFGAAREQLTDPLEAGLDGPGWVDLIADDLARLLDELGLERVVLAGLSMGGYVAFAFLRRHAERLGALALVDTKASADTREAAGNRLKMAERVLAEGVAIVPELMLPVLLGATTRARRSEVVERVTALILEQDPRAIAAAQRGMAGRPDSGGVLGSIGVPVLVLVGAEDEPTPPSASRAMAAAIPGARLVEVPRAGHLAGLEQPEEVNHALYQFVSELGHFTQ
jgi:pimeloyl-ACP methyl ester carboxylesterase